MYKLVPGLHKDEMLRRQNFFHSYPPKGNITLDVRSYNRKGWSFGLIEIFNITAHKWVKAI